MPWTFVSCQHSFKPFKILCGGISLRFFLSAVFSVAAYAFPAIPLQLVFSLVVILLLDYAGGKHFDDRHFLLKGFNPVVPSGMDSYTLTWFLLR